MRRYKDASEIKLGVVGYGGAYNMGRKHLLEAQQFGMVPTAVAEIDPARLEVADTDFPGIQRYASLTEMLDKSDVEMIIIITPHNSHAPLATEALKAGRHVICEKPFCITTAEADGMMAAASVSGRLVTAYHNRHWDGCVLQAVKTIREENAIGDVIRIQAFMGGRKMPGPTWRSSKSVSGGNLYDWGAHLIDYSLQIVNANVTEVTGFATNGYWASKPGHPFPDDANEDEATLIARFDTGARMAIRLSSIEMQPPRWMFKVTGTEGTYLFGLQQWELLKLTDEGHTLSTRGENPDSCHDKFYENVADYLTGKADLVITPEWARRPIHFIDLAYQSAATGESIKTTYQ